MTVTSSNLQGNVTAAIQDDANGFYSVSPTSFNAASQTVTVTWTPTAGGTSTANLVLTTTGTGANTVTVPITGTAQGPTITANPTAVTFTGAYATRTYTQTVTVTGTNLSQNITASLTGANVYSIDKTSLGTSGGTITVTYAPTAAGQTQATLTLSSTGASSVTVPITGTAQAATPTLIVEPASLSFTSDLESSDSKTFSVKGRFISENVTLTLTDPNGVFTLGTATIPASSISEETAVNVNVTFQSANEGNFTGSVTVASNGAESQTVNLTATASDGGTASDAYLDITKYATIDEAGWNTSYVNNLYKYTEYDEVAWLTLPVYGAWSSVYYSPKAQKWIATNYNSSPGTSTMGTTTWNKTDIYLGSSEYFTNTTARYFGNQSPQAQSSSNRTMTFYVKNATAVKLFGLNGSRTTGNSGRTYPTTMYIYECKENADGTLIDGTTAVKSFSNNTNNATINFEATDLDATKIYKVVTGTIRGYLYEIAFQTPLPQEVTLAQIVNDPSVVAGKQYRIVDDNLIGAYLSNDSKYIFCKDDNGYAEQMTKGNKVDFMTEHGWHKLSGVRGTLINKVNPTLQLTKVPTPGEQATVNFNTYLATDFDPEMLAETGNYFFLPAKPMEVANVMWAMWDAASGKFVVASPVNNSTGRIDGAFYADLTKYYNDTNQPIGEIEDGGVYNFIGFAAVNVNGVSASTLKGITTLAEGDAPAMVVYPLENWQRQDKDPNGTITDIYTLDGYREVVGVEYVNATGLTSDKPFKGVNIVVTRYSDGSRTTVKKLYR